MQIINEYQINYTDQTISKHEQNKTKEKEKAVK